MARLNYRDLLALIIEYDIEAVKDYLRQMKSQKGHNKDVEVRVATNEDVLRMHS